MNEYLINQLKLGRLNKGLKQSDVTKKTGIKNTTLSNYENGVTEPDIDTFLQLCELYELDFVSIIEEAYGISVPNKNFSIKPSEIEKIEKYRSLDDRGREMVDSVLEQAYISRPQISEGQLSLFPVDGYYQIWRNGHLENYMKADNLGLNAAHPRTDIEIPENVDTSEDDVMDESKF